MKKTLPIIKDKRVIAKSRLFKIEEVELKFENGVERVYERLMPGEHQSVMVIPMLDQHTFLLIREYAVGIEDYILTFPKGLVEKNEDLYEGANRELMEEVGMGSSCLEFIKKLYLSPGYMSHGINLLVARDLYKKKLDGDEPEQLDVISWKISDIDNLLERPDFIESRSLTAILLLSRLLNS